MKTHLIKAESSAKIHTPSQTLYQFIADYKYGHPSILPEKHFSDFAVEKGGYGKDTVVCFRFTLAGNSRKMRVIVDEPIPGKLITETELETGILTSFLFEPVGDDMTILKITSEWKKEGFMGLIEKIFVPIMMKKVFEKQFENIRDQLLGSVSTIC